LVQRWPNYEIVICHFPLGDSNTLGVWLNGYVNGARGKTLIDPLPQDAPSGAFHCGGQLSSSRIV
jgi:hypothetical protein